MESQKQKFLKILYVIIFPQALIQRGDTTEAVQVN